MKTDVRFLTKCILVHPLSKYEQAWQPRTEPPLQGKVGKCTTRGSLRKPSESPEESPLGLRAGKAGGMPGLVREHSRVAERWAAGPRRDHKADGARSGGFPGHT